MATIINKVGKKGIMINTARHLVYQGSHMDVQYWYGLGARSLPAPSVMEAAWPENATAIVLKVTVEAFPIRQYVIKKTIKKTRKKKAQP